MANISKTAFIIITSKCNRNCSYCFYRQDTFRQKSDKITSRKLIELIKDLKTHNFNGITFTGGEPLLKRGSLLKAIEEACQLGFITNLDTNGILLNRKLVDELKLAGLTRTYLSSQCINYLPINILSYINHLLDAVIIHVVTKENLRNLRKIIKVAEKLRLELIIQPAYISKNYQYFNKLSLWNLSSPQREYLKSMLRYWGERNKKENYVNLILSYYEGRKDNYPKNCHMGIKDIVIDSDGSIFPCFHRQDLLIGNIFQSSLEEILLKMENISKKTKRASCFGEHCLSLFYN